MPERATTTIRADELPPKLAALIRHRPSPSEVVTVEVREPTQEEWLADVRAKLDEGLADIEAGRTVDGEEFFAKMRAKHFPKNDRGK